MSQTPLTQDSITEQLHYQLRGSISGINYLLIPLLYSCVIVVLWILIFTFGGELTLTPTHLIFSAAVLTVILWLGVVVYRKLISNSIKKHPLMIQTPVAMELIQQVVAKSSNRKQILSTVRKQISQILNPTTIDIALYSRSTKTYSFMENGLALPSNDEFVEWVANQSVNTPIRVPVTSISQAAQETQLKIVALGIQMIVRLGDQAWLCLGKPEQNPNYNNAEISVIQYLCQPVSVGLERTALLEIQKEREEELQAIYWITQAVNFSIELDDLLELIYTQLSRVIQLPNFYIALIDLDTGDLSPAFYIKDNDRLLPQNDWIKSEGLISLLLQHKMTIRTSNYLDECQRRGVEAVERDKDKVAWLGTALTANDKNIGVMVASHTDPSKVFSEEDQNFFVTIASYTSTILDRKTLHEQSLSRAMQLNSLVGIGRLLASSLDLNVVLDLVVENAANLLNSVAGSLLLLDEKSGELIFRSSSGPTGPNLVGMRIPPGKGIAGAAFSENRPIISQDTQTDNRWYGRFDKNTEFVTQSLIAVPLNARGRTIGVLEVVNRKDAHPFDTVDSDLLLSFASQAAIAIENARLFTTTDQALQARLEELMTIQYIDRQLNASLDYREVMDQTLEWAIRITHATIGVICAVNETEQGELGLRFLAHKGYKEEDFNLYSEKQLWPFDKGLIGQTVTIGETLLEKDVQNNPQYAELVPGMNAELNVPIKREGRVIGVIALDSEDIDTFTDDNVAFIQRLADHAAIAIDNARLFQQVQQANAAKTQFVSFVSHELKQPVASIKGYCELLSKDIESSVSYQKQQYINVIQDSAEQMDRLVQDLLDISRIESGQLRMEMQPVEPKDIVMDVIRNYEHAITMKNQELTIDVRPGLPVINGDRGRLIQVLSNLLSNAYKYTPEGGKITVRVESITKQNRDYICWRVIDSGIGLTSDELEKIFTKYFRAERALVQNKPGTGLGLVISQSIIELHGGTISVESKYREGSTFSFTVPILHM